MLERNRNQFIGASEIAAVFGLCPFTTPFELAMRKTGKIPEKPENDEMLAGKFLEDGVAAMWENRYGLKTQKNTQTFLEPDFKFLAATPDRFIEDGRVLEIKVSRDEWGAEPPIHYQLQVQQQLLVTGREKAEICQFVLYSCDLRSYSIDFRPKVAEKIVRAAEKFWQQVQEGRLPEPDYKHDLSALKQLYSDNNGSHLDLSGNNHVPVLFEMREKAKEIIKEQQKICEVAEAEILDIMKNYTSASCGPIRIKRTWVKPTPIKEHTRAGYNKLTITSKGE